MWQFFFLYFYLMCLCPGNGSSRKSGIGQQYCSARATGAVEKTDLASSTARQENLNCSKQCQYCHMYILSSINSDYEKNTASTVQPFNRPTIRLSNRPTVHLSVHPAIHSAVLVILIVMEIASLPHLQKNTYFRHQNAFLLFAS